MGRLYRLLALLRPQWKPKAAGERKHPVCGISATITDGNGVWENCSVFQVEVPLSEAAELSSPVWGGPLVLLSPHCSDFRTAGPTYPLAHGWTIWIRAFIREEAMDALHDLERALRPYDNSVREILRPTRWRFRDGELVPLEAWEWPEWGSGVVSQPPPFAPDESLVDWL